ncbi:MAG: hypothetical protein K8S27_01905 [Candidatus Omnitrophica bacterium]|nr:hypothetical protein [Candidatus Omnitrophota bacterium]
MSLFEKILSGLKSLVDLFPRRKKKYNRNIPKVRRTPPADRKKPQSRSTRAFGARPKKKQTSARSTKRRQTGSSAKASASKISPSKKQTGKKTEPRYGKETIVKKASGTPKKALAETPKATRRKDSKSSAKTPGKQRPGSRRKARLMERSPSKRRTQPRGKIQSGKLNSLDEEKYIGAITHYFSRINVVVLKMENGPLRLGDDIHIRGRKTNFKQPVESLQVESFDVKKAEKNQLVGLKVLKPVTVGDQVFKI